MSMAQEYNTQPGFFNCCPVYQLTCPFWTELHSDILFPAVVVGGIDMMTQALVLAKKPHIVIGRPLSFHSMWCLIPKLGLSPFHFSHTRPAGGPPWEYQGIQPPVATVSRHGWSRPNIEHGLWNRSELYVCICWVRGGYVWVKSGCKLQLLPPPSPTPPPSPRWTRFWR